MPSRAVAAGGYPRGTPGSATAKTAAGATRGQWEDSRIDLETYVPFAVALGLGLLVGLQREWSGKRVAGVRTLTLVTLFGAICGELARDAGGGWILAAGLVAVTGVFAISNRLLVTRSGPTSGAGEAGTDGDPGEKPGIATEVAGLLMFVIGALTTSDRIEIAVVVTGVIAVLLQWKQPLHRLVRSVGADEVRAVTRLVLIGMVILPVLPNESFGPGGVLNPFRIWLMVVLIVGISLAAWVAQRALGPRAGTIAAGVLGGLISSTATTAGYARTLRGSAAPHAPSIAAAVVMIASTVVFVRVLGEAAVVAPDRFGDLAPPLAAMMGFMAVISIAAVVAAGRRAGSDGADVDDAPPAGLGSAVAFGAVYAVVLLAVALVEERLGEEALYAVAVLSGLTDMDAITLSTAELVKAGTIEPTLGWRLMLAGAMSNLVFKLVIAASLGGRRLALRLGWMFGASLAAGGLLLWLWPA